MITREETISRLGAVSLGAWLARSYTGPKFSILRDASAGDAQPPPIAPGVPMSSERTALIEAVKKESEGLQNKFEARMHKSDRPMPYRLFRPEARGKLPLVMYLHGGGGLGDDNEK